MVMAAQPQNRRPQRCVQFTGNIFANQRYGGVSRYVVELARRIDQGGQWRPSISAPLFINEYLKNAAFSSPHRGIYLHRRPPALRTINRLIEQFGRLIHASTAEVTHEVLYDWRNLNRAGGLKVATFYDMIHERWMPNPTLLRQKQLTLEASDHVIAISNATKSDLVELLEVDAAKIDVVHLASDIQRHPERVPLVPSAEYLLWVGPRRGYKNFETFSRGLVATRGWKSGLHLVCAGGPPPTAEELSSWGRIGLDPTRVLHCQPDETELASLYTHAMMLIYASLLEGFGIPPLEAMNCRCPVAASAAGSIPEVVGDAGLSFDPQSAEEISWAIDELCESPTLRADLIQKGIERSRHFSWERCASETLAIYERLLGNTMTLKSSSTGQTC